MIYTQYKLNDPLMNATQAMMTTTCYDVIPEHEVICVAFLCSWNQLGTHLQSSCRWLPVTPHTALYLLVKTTKKTPKETT